MGNDEREGVTATYVVECYWPEISEEQVEDALARVTVEADGAGTDDPVCSLGCILVPSDGMAFFLFQGASATGVWDVSRGAELPFDRIVECVNIGLVPQ